MDSARSIDFDHDYVGFYRSNEESSAEIKLHKENLREFCRICGKDRALAGLDGRNPVAKGEYKDVLREVYSLNVDEDNEEVHPPFICRDSCGKTLQADISI